MILKQAIRMNRFSLVNQQQLGEHCDPFPNYNDIKMYWFILWSAFNQPMTLNKLYVMIGLHGLGATNVILLLDNRLY